MSERNTFTEKVVNEFDELVLLWRRRPFLFSLVIIVAVTVISSSLFDKFWGIPKLKADIEGLRRQLQEKALEIQRLETQLLPFRTIALERYPGSESEAMKKLAEQIIEISEEVETLQKYSEVATYNFDGSKCIGYHVKIGTPAPVGGWTINFMSDEDIWEGKIPKAWRCDATALNHYQTIAKQAPTFPFPYYALAICLYSKGDEEWKQYAKYAIYILNKTTKIAGHNPSHDDVLRRLNSILPQE